MENFLFHRQMQKMLVYYKMYSVPCLGFIKLNKVLAQGLEAKEINKKVTYSVSTQFEDHALKNRFTLIRGSTPFSSLIISKSLKKIVWKHIRYTASEYLHCLFVGKTFRLPKFSRYDSPRHQAVQYLPGKEINIFCKVRRCIFSTENASQSLISLIFFPRT